MLESSTSALVESSIGQRLVRLGRVASLMPKVLVRSCSSQCPERMQVRQALGWLLKISFKTVRRTSTSSASEVMTSIPSAIGVEQERMMRPLTLTMQMPQPAVASTSGCLHRVGISMWTLRAASKMEVPAVASTS